MATLMKKVIYWGGSFIISEAQFLIIMVRSMAGCWLHLAMRATGSRLTYIGNLKYCPHSDLPIPQGHTQSNKAVSPNCAIPYQMM